MLIKVYNTLLLHLHCLYCDRPKLWHSVMVMYWNLSLKSLEKGIQETEQLDECWRIMSNAWSTFKNPAKQVWIRWRVWTNSCPSILVFIGTYSKIWPTNQVGDLLFFFFCIWPTKNIPNVHQSNWSTFLMCFGTGF